MSVTTSDLIASIRQRSNTQRTRQVLDDEILGFANDVISELHDIVVESRESYFALTSTFDMPPGSNEISLIEACTGIPFEPPFPYELSGLTVAAMGNTIGIAAPLVGTSTKYQISNFTITPAIANLGQNCNLTLAVNGVATALTVMIPGGFHVGVDNLHVVTVNAADSLSIITAPVDPLLPPGSDWGFTVAFTVTPIQPSSPMFKELALSYGGTNPREVPPLDSIRDRYKVSTPHFLIQGPTLFLYPESQVPPGPFTLTFVPNAPVLADGDALPEELERWKEFIVVGAAITVKIKRQQPTIELDTRYAQLRAHVIQAVTGRRAGPKKIPMPERERSHFGRGCRGRWI